MWSECPIQGVKQVPGRTEERTMNLEWRYVNEGFREEVNKGGIGVNLVVFQAEGQRGLSWRGRGGCVPVWRVGDT